MRRVDGLFLGALCVLCLVVSLGSAVYCHCCAITMPRPAHAPCCAKGCKCCDKCDCGPGKCDCKPGAKCCPSCPCAHLPKRPTGAIGDLPK